MEAGRAIRRKALTRAGRLLLRGGKACSILIVREDDVVIGGTVDSRWVDTDPATGTVAYQWTLLANVDAASAARLVTSDGKTNAFGWLPCAVTPPEPYRLDPTSDGLVGRDHRAECARSGTGCDDASNVIQGTTIQPISWIGVSR